jgi:hypothetical protein
VGLLIALDIFFHAIHVSNVSITLSVFSLGLFASILEHYFMVEKCFGMRCFGLIIIAGLAMIMNVEVNFAGMMYALVSIILGVLFTLMNGKLIETQFSSYFIL